MAANTPSQDLQNISNRFNQLSDDVKSQFLEEQLKILNNAPWPSKLENSFSLNGFGFGILFMGREKFTSPQESEEWYE
jgi:hypothetical protein